MREKEAAEARWKDNERVEAVLAAAAAQDEMVNINNFAEEVKSKLQITKDHITSAGEEKEKRRKIRRMKKLSKFTDDCVWNDKLLAQIA